MLDNRKKYLIVITVITILCIIGGTLYHSFRLTKEIKSEFVESENYDTDYSDSLVDSFTSIDMDVSLMEITIEKGNDFLYEVTFNNEGFKPKAYIDDGTLKIEQRKKRVFLPGSRPMCYVTITVPSNTLLDEIRIESHVGEIDIDGIKANNIRVSSNVDDITISNCISDNIHIESNIGEIKVSNCDVSIAEANTNIGEVHVDTLKDIDEYTLSLNTDLGEVSLDGNKVKKSYSKKGETDKKIIINTNIGEIKIN